MCVHIYGVVLQIYNNVFELRESTVNYWLYKRQFVINSGNNVTEFVLIKSNVCAGKTDGQKWYQTSLNIINT